MMHSNIYQTEDILSDLDKLQSKYKSLQDLYYGLYLMSFNETNDNMEYYDHIHLFKTFKVLCRLLEQIKSLVGETRHQTLGLYELKLLLNHKDVEKFIVKYNLWSTIDSNYEEMYY